MGLFDSARLKALAAAQQTAVKTVESVIEGMQDARVTTELGQAERALGEATFALVESGELAHPKLDELVGRVREIKAKAAPPPAPAPPAS